MFTGPQLANDGPHIAPPGPLRNLSPRERGTDSRRVGRRAGKPHQSDALEITHRCPPPSPLLLPLPQPRLPIRHISEIRVLDHQSIRERGDVRAQAHWRARVTLQ